MREREREREREGRRRDHTLSPSEEERELVQAGLENRSLRLSFDSRVTLCHICVSSLTDALTCFHTAT